MEIFFFNLASPFEKNERVYTHMCTRSACALQCAHIHRTKRCACRVLRAFPPVVADPRVRCVVSARSREARALSALSFGVCVRARDKCVTPPTQARDPIAGGDDDDDDGCSTTTATLLIEMRAQTVVALALAEKSSFIYERGFVLGTLRVGFGAAPK